MPNPSNVIRKIAENVIRLGTPPTFSRAIYIGEIRKRAAEIRVPGDSDAQAFTKCITSDPIGIVLYKASKQAEGPEIERDARQDFVAAPPPAGPAHAAMQRLADEHRRKNPAKTSAQAYAHVYTDPANGALRQRVTAEHLAPRLAQDAQEHEQRESDRFAADQARRYPGERDIYGPKEARARRRINTVAEPEVDPLAVDEFEDDEIEKIEKIAAILTGDPRAERIFKAAELFARARRVGVYR